MKKVYVAGRYSADNVLEVLQNIGRGQKVCATLLASGFSPFCPWHDRTYIIDCPEDLFSVSQMKAHSMEWLRVSDAVFTVYGWEKSQGALDEIAEANRLGIPVFHTFTDLLEWDRAT